MCPCVSSREFKIALVDWHSQIPPMWLAAGEFLFQVIKSPPWSWQKLSILLWSISLNAFNNSCSAPTKLESLSERICLHSLCEQLNLLIAWRNELVLRLCVTSIWTALLARQVNIAWQHFISVLLTLTLNGPNISVAQEVPLQTCP